MLLWKNVKQVLFRMRKIFLIILLFGTVNCFAQNKSSEMEIMMKMLALKTALITKDSLSLSQLLSEDVTYGHTNALIQSKKELIHDIVTTEQDYKIIEPSEMKVRLYDNTAVVNMNSKVEMNYKNLPLVMNMKITLVWIKNKEDWQLVARQSVKLP